MPPSASAVPSILELESEIGKGSVFHFTQAFSISKWQPDQALMEKPQAPSENDKPLEGSVILLVEDNPMNVFVAKSFLEKWGAEIEVAQNGLEAINKLDTERHCLVLMDLHMPVMDGFEAVRQIRRKGITLPIIALTASLPSEIKIEVEDLEIDGMVLKPFVPDELYKAVLRFTAVEQG